MTDQTTDPWGASGASPGGEPASESGRHCPWCAAPAHDEDTVCSACGAALAQRESIGDVPIPGLTAVAPALVELDKRPIQLRGPSPSQGMAPALIIGAVAGGPIGLAAIGGVAAVAGAEFLAARTGGPGSPDLEDVGKPTDLMLQALERAREAETKAASGVGQTGPVDPTAASMAAGNPPPASAPAVNAEPDAVAAEPDPADADHGMSIWRDLP